MLSKSIIRFIKNQRLSCLFVVLGGAVLSVFWHFAKLRGSVVFEVHPSAINSFVEYLRSSPKWLHDVNLHKMSGYDSLWRISPRVFPDERQPIDEAVKQIKKWAINFNEGDKSFRQIVLFHEGASNEPIATDFCLPVDTLIKLKSELHSPTNRNSPANR